MSNKQDVHAQQSSGMGHNGGPPLEITPQTIFRVVNPNKAYTKISNVLLGDTKISFACKGFLVSILMLPVDWTFHVGWLQKTYGIGEDKAYGLVNEAIKRKYCRRVVVRRERGKFERYEYHFSDDPADLPAPEAPLPEKPEMAAPEPRPSPVPENPEVVGAITTSGRNQFRPKPVPAQASSSKSRSIQRKDSDKGLTRNKHSPPPPRSRKRSRGARQRDEINSLIEELRQRPGCAQAVDLLLAPVLRQREFHAPDPAYALGEIADWAKGYRDDVLEAARFKVLDGRYGKVWEEHITKAVKEAAELNGDGRPLDRPSARHTLRGVFLTAEKNPEALAAWETWLERAGGDQANPATAQHRIDLRLLRDYRSFQAPTEWPPASVEAAA